MKNKKLSLLFIFKIFLLYFFALLVMQNLYAAINVTLTNDKTPAGGQLTASWNAVSAPVGTIYYKVYLGTTLKEGNYLSIIKTFTGLTNGTAYYVKIEAWDDCARDVIIGYDKDGKPIKEWRNDPDVKIDDGTSSSVAPTESTPPAIAISSPNAGSVHGTVNVSFTASDVSIISSYKISIDGTVVSNQTSYTWNTLDLTTDNYFIECSATDIYGNTGYKTVIVYVDNSGPDIQLSYFGRVYNSTHTWFGGVITIQMTAWDPSGLKPSDPCILFVGKGSVISEVKRGNSPLFYDWNTCR